MISGASSSSSRRCLPELRDQVRSDNAVLLSLHVPADLAYFPGHFPAQAILPGVVQLDWVVHFSRQFFPLQGRFAKMEVLKFQQVIFPDRDIQMQLTFRPDSSKIAFEIFSGEQRFASGRLVFQA